MLVRMPDTTTTSYMDIWYADMQVRSAEFTINWTLQTLSVSNVKPLGHDGDVMGIEGHHVCFLWQRELVGCRSHCLVDCPGHVC